MQSYLICLLMTSALITPSDNQAPKLPSEEYWQVGSACGPNALYCMLRIHGKTVNYLELLKFLSPPESGSSLEELRQASGRWGLQTVVFKTNRKGLG